MTEKQRMIQEYVPGKQVTLAHLIASPDPVIFEKLGLQTDFQDAIGILTITPSDCNESSRSSDWFCRSL